jgi:hypothetical protein
MNPLPVLYTTALFEEGYGQIGKKEAPHELEQTGHITGSSNGYCINIESRDYR